ncbi:hypothetical protein ACQEVM_38310 [Streptomyces sp. CA-243310]|uniref:hypothetical protein n=1 Tax=Streptomyces sp. CA-243310 TaxID=3240056 RepID=UPI003D8A5F26
MSDEDRSSGKADDEDFHGGDIAGLESGAKVDLSGLYAARLAVDSVNDARDPVAAYAEQMDSAQIEATARAVVPVIEMVVRAQQQFLTQIGPVVPAVMALARQVDDLHSRISKAVSSLSLPLTLLAELARTAAQFLPPNLRGLNQDELSRILYMCEEDGLSLAWAPRTSIVRSALSLSTNVERCTFLAERRDDVLDDIEASLQCVTHPALAGMSLLLNKAVRTAQAGFDEGAQALAGNVLETAMHRHGNDWIRSTFPQAEYQKKKTHHPTIASALGDSTSWADLTLLQFKHFLVLVGLSNAFAPGVATQDTFNRHLGVHQASPHSYRAEFVLPALLLAHALLRALDQDLKQEVTPEPT